MSINTNPTGRTLRLVQAGECWCVDHTGSDLESLIIELFGSPVIPTAFTTVVAAGDVVASLTANPENAGFRFAVQS